MLETESVRRRKVSGGYSLWKVITWIYVEQNQTSSFMVISIIALYFFMVLDKITIY